MNFLTTYRAFMISIALGGTLSFARDMSRILPGTCLQAQYPLAVGLAAAALALCGVAVRRDYRQCRANAPGRNAHYALVFVHAFAAFAVFSQLQISPFTNPEHADTMHSLSGHVLALEGLTLFLEVLTGIRPHIHFRWDAGPLVKIGVTRSEHA